MTLAITGFHLFLIVVGAVVVLFAVSQLILLWVLWLRARNNGIRLGYGLLIRLRLQNFPVHIIVNALIDATHAGIRVEIEDLVGHYWASGNVRRAVRAAILAKRNNIPLTFDQARKIDLAGADFDAVLGSLVKPQTYVVPDPGQSWKPITATARDGKTVAVSISLTARPSLDCDTPLIQVGALMSIVAMTVTLVVNATASHEDLLSQRDAFRRKVADKLKAHDTGYEISEFEILDVAVA